MEIIWRVSAVVIALVALTSCVDEQSGNGDAPTIIGAPQVPLIACEEAPTLYKYVDEDPDDSPEDTELRKREAVIDSCALGRMAYGLSSSKITSISLNSDFKEPDYVGPGTQHTGLDLQGLPPVDQNNPIKLSALEITSVSDGTVVGVNEEYGAVVIKTFIEVVDVDGSKKRSPFQVAYLHMDPIRVHSGQKVDAGITVLGYEAGKGREECEKKYFGRNGTLYCYKSHLHIEMRKADYDTSLVLSTDKNNTDAWESALDPKDYVPSIFSGSVDETGTDYIELICPRSDSGCTPSTPTLSVSSVSPNQIALGSSYQDVTLSGSGFTSSSYHQFSTDGGSSWFWASNAPVFNSTTSLTVAVNNTISRTVYVRVCTSSSSGTCSNSSSITIR